MNEAIGPEDFQPEVRQWNNLTLIIEVLKGQNRKVGKSSMYMSADYGFVQGSVSMEDGDALDVFINPEASEPTSNQIYVIGMLTDGVLEEEKVFLDFDSSVDAKDCFLYHYDSDKLGYLYMMSLQDFEALVALRTVEADIKDRRSAELGLENEEGDDPMDDATQIDEKPGMLTVNEEKSSSSAPLYSLSGTIPRETLMKMVEARKLERKANKSR